MLVNCPKYNSGFAEMPPRTSLQMLVDSEAVTLMHLFRSVIKLVELAESL